jgi:hypothetical protein
VGRLPIPPRGYQSSEDVRLAGFRTLIDGLSIGRCCKIRSTSVLATLVASLACGIPARFTLATPTNRHDARGVQFPSHG